MDTHTHTHTQSCETQPLSKDWRKGTLTNQKLLSSLFNYFIIIISLFHTFTLIKVTQKAETSMKGSLVLPIAAFYLVGVGG